MTRRWKNGAPAPCRLGASILGSDGEFGQLDAAAIVAVCKQAWPEVRNADELHDFLLCVCLLPVALRPDCVRWPNN
jgi:hypothetical protein